VGATLRISVKAPALAPLFQLPLRLKPRFFDLVPPFVKTNGKANYLETFIQPPNIFPISFIFLAAKPY